jgi:hypothetical protein
MKASRLTVFNTYNYFHTVAAKRPLETVEQKFMDFCTENHDVICNENTADNDPIIVKAIMFLV